MNSLINYMMYLLIGTYTGGTSEGIYVYAFNTETGASEYVDVAKIENPSYLTFSEDGAFVYAVTENDGEPSFANALAFDAETGRLTVLNREETKGSAPCHIATDRNGKFVVTANYGGGSISVFEINEQGMLSAVKQVIRFTGTGYDKERQAAPHLHCVKFSPDGKYLFATDLGSDLIYRFTVDISGEGDFLKEESMKSFRVMAGSGPRHFEFHPSGNYVYLINELAGTVVGFRYAEGELTEFQSIEADPLHAKGSGDIAITPDGKYVYASNRLQGDGVAVFSIDEVDGRMTKVGYQLTGIHPRNMVITPNGKFLLVANRDSHTVEVFEIDYQTGLLRNIHKDIPVDRPVCLKFM